MTRPSTAISPCYRSERNRKQAAQLTLSQQSVNEPSGRTADPSQKRGLALGSALRAARRQTPRHPTSIIRHFDNFPASDRPGVSLCVVRATSVIPPESPSMIVRLCLCAALGAVVAAALPSRGHAATCVISGDKTAISVVTDNHRREELQREMPGRHQTRAHGRQLRRQHAAVREGPYALRFRQAGALVRQGRVGGGDVPVTASAHANKSDQMKSRSIAVFRSRLILAAALGRSPQP